MMPSSRDQLTSKAPYFKQIFLQNSLNLYLYNFYDIPDSIVITSFQQGKQTRNLSSFHCVKSVRIRGFSGLHFPKFALNTERYFVSLRIQSERGKTRIRKTPNTDIF